MKNIGIGSLGRRGFMKKLSLAGMGISFWSCTEKESNNLDGTRLLAQNYTEIFHNTDSELYVEGSGLICTPNTGLIAVVPVVPRGSTIKKLGRRGIKTSTTYIISSFNGGANWKIISQLPFYSAVPWIFKNSLYLLAMREGTEYRNDNFYILRSRDNGKTWSDPVLLFSGHFWNCHTGMVVKDNTLYWAIDDLGLKQKRGPRALACDLLKDPMEPESWRMSDPVPFVGIPKLLINQDYSKYSSSYLEPNVVNVYGKLRMILTVKPASQTTSGLCAVLDIKDLGDKLDLTFVQYHPRPGGQLKFCIIWDEVSGLFWSTANIIVDSQNTFEWWGNGNNHDTYTSPVGGNDRRFLMLFYGLDGLNWFPAGCIARARKISQSFMYATLVVDGNDLAIISRSSINAPDQHDADYATFHRIKNFRDLAINLKPDNEDSAN